MSLSGELPERKLQYWDRSTRSSWRDPCRRRSHSTLAICVDRPAAAAMSLFLPPMPRATAASCFTSGCLLISPFLPFPLGGSAGAGFCPTDFFLAFFIVTTLVLPIFPTFASVQWPHSYALTGLSRVPASSSPALSSHPKAPPLASSEQPSS